VRAHGGITKEVSKMSLDLLFKDKFDPEDLVQKSYVARYEGKHGLFVMSKKKLLFVEEKGFMHKSYNLILEIPYNKIRENHIENKSKLILTEVGGKKYSFTFNDASVCALRISNILSAYLLFA
jgi:hypothetical protein